MRYLSLFSGIEAATVAWKPLGWECVAVAEIEPFPCAVLAHHYPEVPNLGDVSLVTEDQLKALGPIDLVVFGSPCQDLSVAGKRKGLAGERSGLFHIAMRIIGWARANNGLRWALWENVPGAFSSNGGRDFAAVVEAMAGLAGVDVPPGGWGYEGAAVGQDGLVEWAVLDAQWFGVAQRRRRVFALSDFGDWVGRCPVLLEPQGLRGDSAPRRESGEGSTTGAAPGVDLRCGCGYRFDLSLGAYGCPNCEGDNGPAVSCQMTIMSSGQANAEIRVDGGAPALTCLHEAPIIAHTLRGEGFNASEDGTGRGTPLVPVSVAIRGREGGGTAELGDEVAGCLRASQGGGDKPHVMAPVAFPANLSGTQHASAINLAPSMGAKNPTAVAFTTEQTMQVRRLTPRECERLQGFPDDYTLIPLPRNIRKQKRNEPDEAYRAYLDAHPMAKNGPRYKALGNSMAVPVMRWIGERIDVAELMGQDKDTRAATAAEE
ncbi:MAG TPA: DNA cytosine methyltransferase [Luteolibacter sp.]|nr:DNA cytosine methyltransferase [Luteolibacter sp.]